MEYVLEATGVRKTYPEFTLKDVTLRVPQGYIMGLIGPNGAGKTTLIKLIMNLIQKDAGEITIFGMDHVTEEARVRSRIGFVYETPPCYNYLKLLEFAAIVGSFYAEWDSRRFRQLAAQFELPLRKSIRSLSRGMRMKYALALALSHNADLVIMDEPTSGLDPVFRRELLDQLAELLLDERKSILFSTHITSDLERIADYVTLIRNGEIVFSEAKDDILKNWALVKGGNDLLTPETSGLFAGYRRGSYNFEALTSDADKARRVLGDAALIERAPLEDIMYYLVEAERTENA